MFNHYIFLLSHQRWRAVSNPTEEWGPALPKFRLEAAKVHEEYGTSMGGSLAVDGSGRRVNIQAVEMENTA